MLVCIYFGMFCKCSQLRLMFDVRGRNPTKESRSIDQGVATRWEFLGDAFGCFMEILMIVVESWQLMVQINKTSVSTWISLSHFTVEMSICFHSDLALFISKCGLMHQLNHSIFFLSVPSHLQGTYKIVSLFNERMLNHVVACAATPIFRDAARSWQKSRSNKARPKKN